MNNIVTNNIFRFVLLLLMQVIICNNINFLGYINPYIYIVFILLFPVKNNRLVFLLIAFMLGMLVDMFSDSGGVHAAAAVLLAYTRPVLLKFSFGMLYEHQVIKFSNLELGSLISYLSIATVIHHLVLFSLEIFNTSQILIILQKTLFSSIFTIILGLLLIILFGKRK
jgi:rod shape-determining protein MreD